MSEPRMNLDTGLPEAGLIVGIDPGDVTGLAVYDVGPGRLALVTSGGFWAVVARLSGQLPSSSAGGRVLGVVVEDSRGLPLYARHRGAVRSRPERDRIARNVGRVDRDIALWAAWLKEAGYRVRCRVPSREPKWDAERLFRVTGYAGPTNQHGRDAARQVWGLGPGHFAALDVPEVDKMDTHKKGGPTPRRV